MGEGFDIPAATVQDVDLSAIDPALAAPILRLGDPMERGEETEEQFAELIRLLVQADHAKAEYLLRRNMDVVAGGPALYRELFGTGKPDEFAAAVEGFREQFGVRLEFVRSHDFLEALYEVTPGPPRLDVFRRLGEPSEVRFNYADPEVVAADVGNRSSEENLSMRWVGGAWQLAEGSRS